MMGISEQCSLVVDMNDTVSTKVQTPKKLSSLFYVSLVELANYTNNSIIMNQPVIQRYFCLTTNQSIVLSVTAYQPNEQS